MKTSLSFFILIAIFTFSVNSYAQSSASASITATIVTPITIQKVKDLSFGNIAAGKSSGIVILQANGVRRAQGGATLPSTSGTITTAEFLVSGEDAFSFSITLPTFPVTLANAGNTNETMLVDTFTSTPENSGTFSSGILTVKVGAKLNIHADQSPGLYTSLAPFNVTVNYN